MNEEEVKLHLPEITALTTEIKSDSMMLWSETKKKDFTEKFNQRTRVSQYVMLKTAILVRDKALEMHFISSKHVGEDGYELVNMLTQTQDRNIPPTDGRNYISYGSYAGFVGGRTLAELDKIAKERADAILSNLPELKVAVQIISPEISKLIEERDDLLDKGKKLFDQADELAGQLHMEDVDQKMTVADFRVYVKDRNKKRREYLEQLDEIGKEAKTRDTRINKFLYSGLPGLSQAVIDIVNNLKEKAIALGTLNRRVEEKVMFGDSTAAVTLLQSFEKDEVSVSGEVKAQFDKALEQLKLAGVKKAKVLKKGKAHA